MPRPDYDLLVIGAGINYQPPLGSCWYGANSSALNAVPFGEVRYHAVVS